MNYEILFIKERDDLNMLKNIAWNTFKQTGDINSYLEFREVKNIEENMKVILDETYKSKWDNNCRK